MKIRNRGHLKRLIQRGLIEAKCIYSLTDDYAWDNANNFGKTDWKPARIGEEPVKGYITFYESDLKTKSGCLLEDRDEEGLYTLIVHSNLAYKIRFKKGALEQLNGSNLSESEMQELFETGTIEDFTHTKTGEKLKVLKLSKRLTKEEFKQFNEWLKRAKQGYYSKFAKGFILLTQTTKSKEG